MPFSTTSRGVFDAAPPPLAADVSIRLPPVRTKPGLLGDDAGVRPSRELFPVDATRFRNSQVRRKNNSPSATPSKMSQPVQSITSNPSIIQASGSNSGNRRICTAATKASNSSIVTHSHLACGIAAAVQAHSKIPVYQFTSPMTRYFGSPTEPVPVLPSLARLPASLAMAGGSNGGGGLTADRVTDFLKNNRNFLEDHVLEHIERETLERWLIRRTQREKKAKSGIHPLEEAGRKISLSRWKFCVHADKRQMLETLMNSLANQPQPGRILWELASCITAAVGADGFILHLVNPHTRQLRVFRSCESDADIDNGSFHLSADDSGSTSPSSSSTTTSSAKQQPEEKDKESSSGVKGKTSKSQHSVASYIAHYRHTVTVKDIRLPDARFPAGSLCQQEGGIYIIGAPVIQNDGTLTGVIELYRRSSETGRSSPPRQPFHEEDEEIVSSYLVWGGIALHYADMYHALANQRNLHQFLLTVVKSIFQDMISMDSLIAKVMTFAQKLVDADRASLFLVDHKAGQLYPRIFDMGGGIDTEQSRTLVETQEIRFNVGTGIAGQVAITGRGLNIVDAYSDPRFNRAVDQQTGYQTRTILCMPIFSQNQVIGVVQMVNKRNGVFTAEDEEAFEHFAVYCGLALHHAKLYDRIQVSEQKYKVALDVLSYHNCCSEEEFAALKQQIYCPTADSSLESSEASASGSATGRSDSPITPIGLDQFWFSAFSIGDTEKVNSAVYMFVDLFGLTRFDRDSLIRFTLTVRKNYRRVPYHNWTHGFAVANSMYAILKRAPEAFEPLEAVALFVGSLCHDLDHRGKNNKFMLETASPLAAIYTTSTMEHHHFNQTVTILQQEGHNIFGKLTSQEYKEVLRNIKHCILATDLATFDNNQKRLSRVADNDEFSWKNKEHRLLLQAIAMTGSDLCASSKPWDVQAETVKVIFEEFYEQGDAERAAGRTPIPMMDRRKPQEQPPSQVGFISAICIPCYGLLYRLIPETKPLLDGCQNNLQRWKELASENRQVVQEQQDASISNGSAEVTGSSWAMAETKTSLPPPSLGPLTRTVSLPNSIASCDLELLDV